MVSVDRDPRRALVDHRIGMTDMVKRSTRRADEVSRAEFRSGLQRLERLCTFLRPSAVCMVGLSGWREAVDRSAIAGWQERRLGDSPVYVMPSTSGLNAHAQLPDLTEHLRTGPRDLEGSPRLTNEAQAPSMASSMSTPGNGMIAKGRTRDSVVDVALHVGPTRVGVTMDDQFIDDLIGDLPECPLAVAGGPLFPVLAQGIAPTHPLVERLVDGHVEVSRRGELSGGEGGLTVRCRRDEDPGHDLRVGVLGADHSGNGAHVVGRQPS